MKEQENKPEYTSPYKSHKSPFKYLYILKIKGKLIQKSNKDINSSATVQELNSVSNLKIFISSPSSIVLPPKINFGYYKNDNKSR